MDNNSVPVLATLYSSSPMPITLNHHKKEKKLLKMTGSLMNGQHFRERWNVTQKSNAVKVLQVLRASQPTGNLEHMITSDTLVMFVHYYSSVRNINVAFVNAQCVHMH